MDLFSIVVESDHRRCRAGGEAANAAAEDVDCPDVNVRTGAATLMIGSKPGEGEPAALDVRYQGSIIRTARECHVNAGIMTMKVGIEGRIITGPAGGPGTVDVPLRIAVVHEGVDPKTMVSKFGRETVIVDSAVDRVTFTHVDPDIAFPLPQPVGRYRPLRGLCRLRSDQRRAGKEAPPPKRKKPVAKKKPAAKPKQS